MEVRCSMAATLGRAGEVLVRFPTTVVNNKQ